MRESPGGSQADEEVGDSAGESGDDVLAGEVLVLGEACGGPVLTDDVDGARFGVDDPGQLGAGSEKIIDPAFEVLGDVVRRNDLDRQIRGDRDVAVGQLVVRKSSLGDE